MLGIESEQRDGEGWESRYNYVLHGISDAGVLEDYSLGPQLFVHVLVLDMARFNRMIAALPFYIGLDFSDSIFTYYPGNLYESIMNDSAISTRGTLTRCFTHTARDQWRLETALRDNKRNGSYSLSSLLLNPLIKMNFAYSLQVAQQTRHFAYINLLNRSVKIANKKIISASAVIERVFHKVPLISFDIECISENVNSFPSGLMADEAICSVSVVTRYRSRELNILYVLAPNESWSDAEAKKKIEEKVRTRRENAELVIRSFGDEKALLFGLGADMVSCEFLRRVGCRPGKMCIWTGYNIDAFDYPYIYNRFVYHHMWDFANNLSLANGFGHYGISVDLIPFEMKFYRFSLNNNLKLDNVARTFLNDTKVPLHVTKIRYIYNRPADYDLNSAAEELAGGVPSLNHFLYYNIIDCALVLDLFDKQNILTLLRSASDWFSLPFNRAVILGFSHSLRNCMFTFGLDRQHWMDGIESVFVSGNNVDGGFVRKLRNVDADSVDIDVLLRTVEAEDVTPLIEDDDNDDDDDDNNDYEMECRRLVSQPIIQLVNAADQEIEAADLDLLVLSKAFGGGANAARPVIARNVFGLDFKSFYPSIIQEYSLDLNSVTVMRARDFRRNPAIANELLQHHYVFPYSNKPEGDLLDDSLPPQQLTNLDECEGTLLVIVRNEKAVLNSLVEFLLAERARIKKLYATSDEETTVLLKGQELMVKTMACAIFGVLGFNHFEYKFFPTAAAITFLARKHIHETVLLLREEYGIETVYVDTDGILCVCRDNIRIEEHQLSALADSVTAAINSRNGKIILEAEQVYNISIILSKKKYINWFGSGDLHSKTIYKGFEKNASPAIKRVIRKWFEFLFEQLDRYATNNIINLTVDETILMLAIFNELQNVYDSSSPRDFIVWKRVTESTNDTTLADFYSRMFAMGISLNDKVPAVPLYINGIFSWQHFDYVNFNDPSLRIAFNVLFRNYFQYIVSFSNSRPVKISPTNISQTWDRFRAVPFAHRSSHVDNIYFVNVPMQIK